MARERNRIAPQSWMCWVLEKRWKRRRKIASGKCDTMSRSSSLDLHKRTPQFGKQDSCEVLCFCRTLTSLLNVHDNIIRMSKLCSAPTCSKELTVDSPYYTCCDPSQKYCQECSLTERCSKCHRLEKKQQILRICSKCDGKVNLYKCGCKIVCQACNLQRDSQENV